MMKPMKAQEQGWQEAVLNSNNHIDCYKKDS